MNFSEKMHNGENAFEVLLYLYKQCKHHTKDAFSQARTQGGSLDANEPPL